MHTAEKAAIPFSFAIIAAKRNFLAVVEKSVDKTVARGTADGIQLRISYLSPFLQLIVNPYFQVVAVVPHQADTESMGKLKCL